MKAEVKMAVRNTPDKEGKQGRDLGQDIPTSNEQT
jgi:hypothetical protein